jgi:hypothetical protein
MAAQISFADVKAFIPNSLPDSVIYSYILISDQADACLDGSALDDNIQQALKLNAVAHMITLATAASGEVVNETSRTGASVTYKQNQGGLGLASTSYGRLLQQIDSTGCLTGLFKSPRFINVIGRDE